MSAELEVNMDQINTDLQYETFSGDISKHVKTVKKGLIGKERPNALTEIGRASCRERV